MLERKIFLTTNKLNAFPYLRFDREILSRSVIETKYNYYADFIFLQALLEHMELKQNIQFKTFDVKPPTRHEITFMMESSENFFALWIVRALDLFTLIELRGLQLSGFLQLSSFQNRGFLNLGSIPASSWLP